MPVPESAGDEAPQQLMESFKLNLYQDEIYVFTPKGDLRILPKGATPIDFAFDIHSAVGAKCIGAKVNGRIVPLDHRLETGDQVEILTSRARSGPERLLAGARRRYTRAALGLGAVLCCARGATRAPAGQSGRQGGLDGHL